MANRIPSSSIVNPEIMEVPVQGLPVAEGLSDFGLAPSPVLFLCAGTAVLDWVANGEGMTFLNISAGYRAYPDFEFYIQKNDHQQLANHAELRRH